MMFILFTASWTTLYAFTAILFIFCDAMDSLAGMASGVVSLMITVIFWVRNDPAVSSCAHRAYRAHSLERLDPAVPHHPRRRRMSRTADDLSVRDYPLKLTKTRPFTSTCRCRQLETVEALGWVLGLLAGGALAGCSSSHRRKPRR